MPEMITGIINEEWRSIDGYPNYQVSNIGRVRNQHGQRLKCKTERNGYLRIGLIGSSRTRKFFGVHRLVATEFIPNPKELEYVDHRDGNKANNTIMNLRWCSGMQNQGNRQKQQAHTSSKYKGVTWLRHQQKWRAQLNIKGKSSGYLGVFDNEADAARKYNEAAIAHFGSDFAKLNIIDE